MRQLDILIFAPHPDDAELGMGGSILRWRAEGRRVGVADMVRGEMGTKGDAETRMKEAAEAGRRLDLNFRTNLDLGDGRVVDSEASRLKVIETIRQTKPRAVFAPCPFDRHPDHAAGAQLVCAAQFLARLPKMETASPAHSVNTIFHYFLPDHIRPTFVIDITPFHEKKLEALSAYRSQFVEPKVPEDYRYGGTSDYLRQVEAYDKTWGAKIGVEYAEAYHADRPFAVHDVTALFS